jgi:hypothetical protein
VRCGCTKDAWNSQLAAIDMYGAVKNLTFNNNKIYDAQHDGIRVSADPSNIVFNNTKIYGAGVDGTTSRKGAALNLDNGKNVIFNGIEIANSAYNNSAGYPIYSSLYSNISTTNINDYKNVNGQGYTIASYPAVGIFNPNESSTSAKPEVTTTSASKSNVVKASVKVGTTKVKSATKKQTASKVKISLKKTKSVTGYQIQISTDKKFKKILVSKKVKKVQFTLASKKIKNKKTLYIKARAYKKSGKKTYTGKWTNAKKIKVTK